jgi:predicted dithiol-disulfide oxidoreductase (DUF899 family)
MSTMESVAHPPIVTREEWLIERKELLELEKDLMRQYDVVNAERRRLPMVKVEKTYEFDGPNGKTTLLDLFAGRRQLIVYHFMFDPAWEKGCPGCTSFIDSQGSLALLAERNTTFAMVSRAPLEKLQRYQAERGWQRTWVSSFETDFNYDFHVTMDEVIAPPSYNYRAHGELLARQADEPWFVKGEVHGLSVFFRLEEDVFHAYSAYARGVERLADAYSLLDRTPYGRQESFEDSPEGWPQRPTYG